MSFFDTSWKGLKMLTQEEKEEIIAAAVERTLLAIPEVIGNLMANHAMLHKLNSEFYKAHPEFAKRKDIVQAVVEYTEGKNPLSKYEDILEKSVPEIERRMLAIKDVSVDDVPKAIPRDFSKVDISQNGVL
jgi:hypothetical protein